MNSGPVGLRGSIFEFMNLRAGMSVVIYVLTNQCDVYLTGLHTQCSADDRDPCVKVPVSDRDCTGCQPQRHSHCKPHVQMFW